MRLRLVGTGMGNALGLTVLGRQALEEADVILGAPRLLDGLPRNDRACRLPVTLPDETAQKIRQHPEWGNVCVVLSGDVGFYSAASKLTKLLADLTPELICGISSPQQLAARLRRPWQDFRLVSGHGRDCDAVAETLNHPAVFFLTGGELTPCALCNALMQAGLGDAAVTVGENLGAAGERITASTAAGLAGEKFAPLSVVLVENRRSFTRRAASPGIADGDFIRGGVPMTKREVRVNILSLLEICSDDVLFDIGAGTGSVAVEMALLARRGKVYAVERKREACALIGQNKEKFGAYNLHVVEGEAPDALNGLPAPQAAFVGGSNGRLRPILQCLLQMNPNLRAAVGAVTLETLHEATSVMQELGMARVEAVQIAVSRAVKTGSLHMLRASNPVFLISGGGRHDD